MGLQGEHLIMFSFLVFKRKKVHARGELQLPSFTIYYVDLQTVEPYEVFSVNLHAQGVAAWQRCVYRDVPMRLAKKCLRENSGNVKSSELDMRAWSLKLVFEQPVRVGEWDNIVSVTLSYRLQVHPLPQPAVVMDLTNEAD